MDCHCTRKLTFYEAGADMEIIVPIAAVVLIIIFVAYVRRGQTKIGCPNCESLQVRTVDQQLKKLTQDRTSGHNLKGIGGIGGFGMKLDVQLIVETHYRCRSCEHSWSVIAPES
jgi:hypothetical protein